MNPVNKILSQLEPDDLVHLLPSMTEVVLKMGDPIGVEDRRLAHVCFPSTAILSVAAVMNNGRPIEISTVGSEGAVGLLHALADEPHMCGVSVQAPGSAFCVPAPALLEIAERRPTIMRRFLKAAVASVDHAQQSVACNALHDAAQRMSRLILQASDRAGQPEVTLDQGQIAMALGVQRTTVSLAAKTLKGEGLIDYSRGRIAILERQALQRRACECYEILKEHWPLAFNATRRVSQ